MWNVVGEEKVGNNRFTIYRPGGGAAGFTLIEILIAAGLLGVLSMFMANTLTFSARSQKSLGVASDFQQLTQSLSQVLMNAQSCAIAFKSAAGSATPLSVNPAGAFPVPIPEISLPGTVIASLNQADAGGNFINKLQFTQVSQALTPITDASGATRNQTIVQMDIGATPKVTGGAVGNQSRNSTMFITLLTDQATNQITACYPAQSPGRACLDMGGIYNAAGTPSCVLPSLGVGLNIMPYTTPLTTLQLAGSQTLNYSTVFAPGNPGQAVGNLHLSFNPNSADGDSTAITFGGQHGQAGIYVQSSGGYGTRMYFGTTPTFAYGAQTYMEIDEVGRVGIGYITPAENAPGAQFTLQSPVNSNDLMEVLSHDGTASIFHITQNMPSGGAVGIGTTTPGFKLDVVGDINSSTSLRIAGNSVCTAAGCTASASDARFKRNVVEISDALAKVTKLRGVSYEFKTEAFPERHFDGEKQIGVIAQEVEKIVPEVVRTDDQGYQAVDYGKLTAVLIEAVKSQERTIRTLRDRLEKLEGQAKTGK